MEEFFVSQVRLTVIVSTAVAKEKPLVLSCLTGLNVIVTKRGTDKTAGVSDCLYQDNKTPLERNSMRLSDSGAGFPLSRSFVLPGSTSVSPVVIDR